MKKRMIIMIIALAVVFGGIFGFKAFGIYMRNQYFAHFQPPPTSVATAPAQSRTWQPTLSAVGSVTAINGVDVTPEVAGQVKTLLFHSGQEVKKGDLLLQLDDQSDRAELAGLLAQRDLAQISYQRELKLAKTRTTSESNLDTARTELKRAEAALENQRIMIGKKAIRAPFSGRLGIRKVNLGQYLSPGTPIVTLQSIDPVHVDFSLPTQALATLHVGQPVTVSVDAYNGRSFSGKISAIDSRISEKTRNVDVQATLDNPQHLLQPGMFASVQVILPQQDNVVTVPRTAINYSLYGDSVFVVEADGKDDKGAPKQKAVQRFVVTGDERGESVAITKGLKAGEQVVVAGQFKLHNGAPVVINNSVLPDAAGKAQ